MPKLRVKLKATPVLEVHRASQGNQKLVYVLLANKTLRYEHGTRSRVAYIGTTKNGLSRIASSAAVKAEQILSLHGVRTIEARIVMCAPRAGVKTWVKLERALLLLFRERHGRVPKFNTQGKKLRLRDELTCFSRSRLATILDALEKSR